MKIFTQGTQTLCYNLILTNADTHTHYFNGHFPGDPGLVCCPLIIRGVEASFYRWDSLPLAKPKALKD